MIAAGIVLLTVGGVDLTRRSLTGMRRAIVLAVLGLVVLIASAGADAARRRDPANALVPAGASTNEGVGWRRALCRRAGQNAEVDEAQMGSADLSRENCADGDSKSML